MMQSSIRPPPRPKGPVWPGPNHVVIFLRNLKLLGLDKHQDWPDITVETLSPSQANSRRRIHAVEWSLYHLFHIWDPVETNNKLRPFFPPLEPLQSVNLRAALFRALSDLKKNGDLGREAILRKTMLDECKGEKFEELLAAFSTAVLRRVLSFEKQTFDNPAIRISLSSRPSTPDQEALVPLILAHRSSLAGLIEERKQLGDSYEGYENLFRDTLADISSKAKDAAQPSREELHTFEQIRQDITNWWSGSASWADVLLEGGSSANTNPFLEMEFPHAWSIVKRGGTVTDVPAVGSVDLLADLQNRIAQQQSRLQRWKEFSKSLASEKKHESTRNPLKTTTPLLFRQHQELSVINRKPDVQVATVQKQEYATLIADMENALGNIHGYAVPILKSTSLVAPTLQVDVGHEEETSGKGDGMTPNAASARSRPSITSQTSSPYLVPPNNGLESPQDQESIDLPSRITSINHSNTPSVIVHPGIEQNIEAADESHPANPTSDPSGPVESRRASTLTERTRLSISRLSETTTSKPRHSLTKPPRQSQTFPINPWDTPQKDEQDQRSGAVTPREDLFSEDADYTSVFKSRPKVAMSPVNTPPVHIPLFPDAEGAYEEDDHQIGDFTLDSSPLVSRQNRRF
ncbi:hypothetical protein VTO42DRAFT_7640 [Malbranchea cinnamomea]